jgi:hypothetical protein
MSGSWDSCISCGKELDESDVENWRKCLKCKFIHLFLNLATLLSISILVGYRKRKAKGVLTNLRLSRSKPVVRKEFAEFL